MSVVDTSTYIAKNAGHDWSLTNPTSDTFRFEVRDNDFALSDAGAANASERSDISIGGAIAMGIPLHLNFDLTVEPGDRNSSNYFVLGSFVSTMEDGSVAKVSAFDIDLLGEQLVVYIRYTDGAGKAVGKQIYLDGRHIVRGETYNIDVKAVFDPSGNGRLVISRDGAVIADYSGPLGYAGQASVTWSQGINRSAEATETAAVEFGRLTLETGDGVEMPAVTNFIQAPSLAIKNVSYAEGSDNVFEASMYGHALGRSKVSIYADGEFVGSTFANAAGAYSIVVDVKGEGAHRLVAVSSDNTGRPGIASYPAGFTIGGANDPGATRPISFILAMGGETYWIENANKSWSVSSPEPDVLRFEVRDRDVYWWDLKHGGVSERSEARSEVEIANGTPLEISYQLNVEPGAKNNAYFLLLGQLHQDDYPGALPWSPPFAFAMDGERMALDIRYTGADGLPVTKRIFTDVSDIVRGKYYDIDIKAVFDPAGEGRLVVTRDGVIIADYSGPLGYIQQNGVYWKEGVYRHNNATDTFAANFKGLTITTGDAIQFPDKDAFIAAPTVDSTVVGTPDAAGASVIAVTGTAKPGATVGIYEGAMLIASAATDAKGNFIATWTLDSIGHHSFAAVATDAEGRSGIGSKQMIVEMDTAANVAAAIPALAKEAGLVSIVLTDTHVLPVASRAQIDTFLKSGGAALAKIQGSFVFQITTNPVGQGYDKQVETYDSTGLLMERARYSGTKTIYDEMIGTDGVRTIKIVTSAGGLNVNTYSKAGAMMESDRFNAAGILYLQEIRSPDGSRISHNYDQTTGIETGYTAYSASGQKQVVTVNIVNQAYTTQAFTYSSAGKLILQERLNADGASIFKQVWFDDGTYTVRTGLIQDQAYSTKIVLYSAAGKIVGTDTLDVTDKLLTSERLGDDGSVKTYAVNSAGQKIGSTTTAVDGSSTVVKFAVGHEELPISAMKYATGGRLSEIDKFDASGKLVKTEIWKTDGSREFHNFDPVTGKETGYLVNYADRSRLEANLDVTGKDYAQQFATYDATGKLVSMIRKHGDAEHTLAFSQQKFADGSSEVHNYDAAGREIARLLGHADGSRDAFTFTYADDAATPATVLQKHFGTSGARQWTDATKADGSHVQTALGAGAVMLSHAGVTDVFSGLRSSSDTFAFEKGFGRDVISGFQTSGTFADVVQFDDGVVQDYAHLATMMKQVAADTVITIGDADVITLKNVSPSSLSEQNFSFVHHDVLQS